jgi:hypothetical protein
MSSDLKPLSLPPLMTERLPLGYHRILVSDDILDDEATKRLTFEHLKYRHTATHVRRPLKPISKVEL